jgi:hypothetical protein
VLTLKLLLVAASVLLSTQAARRFGHRIGGTVAGLPMIAAPITAILLVDQSAGQVQAIALATLACLPAAVLHIVAFAHAGRRWPWPVCVTLALAVFWTSGALLTALALPALAACALALASPMLGLQLAPRAHVLPGPAPVPRGELVLRIAAAVAMAAAIILGAAVLPPVVSGLLLAMPITGTVLPCFTLPRYGADATASLLAGFVHGLHGFAAFFVALYFALDALPPAAAFLAALAAAVATAIAVQWLRRLRLASRASWRTR